MHKKKIFLIGIALILIIFLDLATAATLKGSIYNSKLDLETNVLVEVNSVPLQKYLSKDGNYAFELSPGMYNITVKKSDLEIFEQVNIVNEGQYIIDLFLLPNTNSEEELWKELQQDLSPEDLTVGESNSDYWIIGGGLLLIVLGMLMLYFKRSKKVQSKHPTEEGLEEESEESSADVKTAEQLKEELAKEPGYLEQTLEIIKKHDGRIHQKELRREMMHLSEAKVSLILTELEHKSKIERVKKGRGNVIILK